MRVDFDEEKHQKTIGVRGLDMARASEVFAGATLTAEDDRRKYGEIR